jgi:hypothetical protein
MEKEKPPVEVFAGTAWQVALVQSLLKDSEIGSFTQDTVMGTMLPWFVEGGGVGAIKVFVSQENEAKALAVVDEYLKNSE